LSPSPSQRIKTSSEQGPLASASRRQSFALDMCVWVLSTGVAFLLRVRCDGWMDRDIDGGAEGSRQHRSHPKEAPYRGQWIALC